MDNQKAIEVMFNEWKCIDRNDGINCDRKCESCDLVMDVQTIREAFNMAISALQEQEAKTQLSRDDTTLGVQKNCVTCKHYPESKWPCIDCDMRNPANRWEPQEAKNLSESSFTHKALDTVSRQAAIEALCSDCQGRCIPCESYPCSEVEAINALPFAQPERKNGKWIRTDMTDIVYGERIGWVKWNCSECGIEKKIGWAKGVNFCPNCGADMRGDSSE